MVGVVARTLHLHAVISQLVGGLERTSERDRPALKPPSRQRSRRLSKDEVDLAVQMYAEGSLMREIGLRLGVHRTAISRHLARRGVEPLWGGWQERRRS